MASLQDIEEAEPASTRHFFTSRGAEERFYLFNSVAVVLNLALLAVVAGLFLGLLTLDVMDLQILERISKDEDERRYARELLPIVKKRHLLLVTILLVNSLAYESLPIFLEALVPGWVAIFLSCTLVLVFGEILPSGVFTGPNQLYLAYTMAPPVKFCMWLFYPLANPIAQLLDYLTQDGEDENDGEAYDREKLSALVRIQHEERMKKQSLHRRAIIKNVFKYQRNKDRQWNTLKSEIMERVNEMHSEATINADNNSDENDTDATSPNRFGGSGNDSCGGAAMEQLVPPLHPTEVDMVEGVLSFRTKLAMDVYTPISHVYALPHDLILNKRTITGIFYRAYSRVPVYYRNPEKPDDQSCYMGFLTTRNLIMVDWEDERELSTLYLKRPTCVSPRTNLVEVLKTLQNDGPQMSFVCARPDLANKALLAEEPIPVEAGLMGIVTIVDIMESILQDRIYDEADIRDRDRAVNTLTRWAEEKLQSFLLKKTKNAATRRDSASSAVSENQKRCLPQSSSKAPETTTANSMFSALFAPSSRKHNNTTTDPSINQQPSNRSTVTNESTPLLSSGRDQQRMDDGEYFKEEV